MSNTKRPPEVHKRKRRRWAKLAQTATAEQIIGEIKRGESTFVMTFGQLALMDALIVIIGQSGPASVDVLTWTITDIDIEQIAEFISQGKITRFRILLDCSFQARQPIWDQMLRTAFGDDAIRIIKSHAKCVIVRSATMDVVVHASMNMNRNPRLENMEICEDRGFAEFFTEIVDSIFTEVSPGENRTKMMEFDGVPQVQIFKQVKARKLVRSAINEPKTTHTLHKL